MRIASREVSDLNTRFVLELDDLSMVEAVVYRHHTLCVSSQVGCAVGCPFCASGKNGLLRNITFEEMVGQVELTQASAPELRRVTISGVGEPLHNIPTLERFLPWCRQQRLAPSITTSAGPLSKLQALFNMPHNGVTISVHAGSEPMRRQLVPRGPSLGALFKDLARVLPQLSKSRKRRVSLAYLLLDGVNDGQQETELFAQRALATGLSVYLYRLNHVPNSAYRRSHVYDNVYDAWVQAGLEVRRSSLARVESNGGCGTLVACGGGASCKDIWPLLGPKSHQLQQPNTRLVKELAKSPSGSRRLRTR